MTKNLILRMPNHAQVYLRGKNEMNSVIELFEYLEKQNELPSRLNFVQILFGGVGVILDI